MAEELDNAFDDNLSRRQVVTARGWVPQNFLPWPSWTVMTGETVRRCSRHRIPENVGRREPKGATNSTPGKALAHQLT